MATDGNRTASIPFGFMERVVGKCYEILHAALTGDRMITSLPEPQRGVQVAHGIGWISSAP